MTEVTGIAAGLTRKCESWLILGHEGVSTMMSICCKDDDDLRGCLSDHEFGKAQAPSSVPAGQTKHRRIIPSRGVERSTVPKVRRKNWHVR